LSAAISTALSVSIAGAASVTTFNGAHFVIAQRFQVAESGFFGSFHVFEKNMISMKVAIHAGWFEPEATILPTFSNIPGY
jgi:hypothetical protein